MSASGLEAIPDWRLTLTVVQPRSMTNATLLVGPTLEHFEQFPRSEKPVFFQPGNVSAFGVGADTQKLFLSVDDAQPHALTLDGQSFTVRLLKVDYRGERIDRQQCYSFELLALG